jgi:hypothetical protein
MADAVSYIKRTANTDILTRYTPPFDTYILSESVLFSGTLRYNLDPCGLYDDTQLWSAITAAHLNHFVSRLPAKLSYQVHNSTITTTSMSLLLLLLLCKDVHRNMPLVYLQTYKIAKVEYQLIRKLYCNQHCASNHIR